MDNTAEIAAIESRLNDGANFIAADGQQLGLDLKEQSKRLRDLLDTDDVRSGQRPRVCRIELGNGPN